MCQNGLHVKRLFVKKLKILYSSDHPILFKFRQLVVYIVIKGVLHPRPVFGLFFHFSQKLQHIGHK